jgi:hypothetical protein
VERFVGVDVADSGYERLVEQQGFYRGFPAAYVFGETFCGEVGVECVWAKPCEGFAQIGKSANRTPAAGVDQHHSQVFCAVAEGEFDAGEAGRWFVVVEDLDATCHAHVEAKYALIEDRGDLLAAPFESHDLAAG